MDRQSLLRELLDELAAHSPTAAMRHMRHWPGGRLSLVHVNVLAILELDGPLTMRGLAEAMDVSQASATGIVDRMEQRGLVERRRDDEDRRVVRVTLTDEGRRLVSGMTAERRDHLATMLDTLTDQELAGFLLGSRAMRRARDRYHAGQLPTADAADAGQLPTADAADSADCTGDHPTPGAAEPRSPSSPPEAAR